ncbi:hypothetical protein [Pectinatus haikarae]|uniref:HMA domain-containing protein n=1 Tax=Pectinatus haikarae TaxID=349096 RepID=A0ABT9Y4F0_9FIRM|nr:hypothetical protein [Pectinatus haikarae]MDQ0202380.1 hypothetical protein [Pectinatus haikarae]
MCSTCGCSSHGQGTQIQFFVTGYDAKNSKAVEEKLLGLPGVLYVHIHTHDGETTINYDPAKTRLSELTAVFEQKGLQAAI